MLLEHERDYDFGMDALVTVCSWNTNGIMILAWYECSPSLEWLDLSLPMAALHYGGAFAWRARRICGLNGSITEALSRGGRAEFAA